MEKLISGLVTGLKGERYVLEDRIGSRDAAEILLEKFGQLLRGSWKSLWFRKRSGLVFAGRRVRVRFARNIVCGKNLTLGDGVFINALCRQGVRFGDNVSIGRNTTVECTGVLRELGEGITLGSHVGISPGCFIGVRGKIEIGDNTILGPMVSLHAENHNYADASVPIRLQGTSRRGITVGRDCWIGAKATILDGVSVGDGAVIAAGALVNRDVPACAVAGGVPAKVLKMRARREGAAE